MKKGDRIRCKRACGELPKGAEGICEIPPGEITGQGKFMGGTYGISLGYFEVIPPVAGMDGARSALEVQQGGTHYKSLSVQPVEYIHANKIGYFEGNVIKYVTRWKEKNGIQDLEKAKHYLELLIELETKKAV